MVVLSEIPALFLLEGLPAFFFVGSLRLLGIESSLNNGPRFRYGLLIRFLHALDLASRIEAQLVGRARRLYDKMLL